MLDFNKLKYEKTAELIYEKISRRAKLCKKLNPELTNFDIYSRNPSVASNILNNIRTNNNPYLVPGRMFTDEDERINQATFISKNLGFSSVNHFLWGNKDEFESYSGIFFRELICEALKYADNETKKIIIKALCLYAPYTLLHTYEELIKKDYYKSLEFEYDPQYEDIDFYSALSRLFIMVKEPFVEKYIDFFYGKTTLKLNNTIEQFAVKEVTKIIKEYIENDKSFGKTFQSVIETITQYMSDDVIDNLPDDILSESDKKIIETHKIYVDESFKYFKKLEALQEEIEGTYDFKMILFSDNWSEELCLLN